MARRGSKRRSRTTERKTPLTPWKRTDISVPPIELLSTDQIETIHQSSLEVLSRHGMRVLSAHVRESYAKAGNKVDHGTEMVHFDPGYIEEAVAKTPSSYMIHSRNPERSGYIGGNTINFAPVGGPSFTSDLDKGRRSGTDESQMSLRAVVMGHAEVVVHSAGWLEGGLVGSFEKLIIDAEMLQIRTRTTQR